MTFSEGRTSISSSYSINGVVHISVVDSICDLGGGEVVPSLNSKAHIDNVIRKAFKTLGFIERI